MSRALLVLALLAGSAHADRTPKPKPVTARVVDVEILDDARIVTVLAGSEQGVAKTWRAKFRAAATPKPLEGGEAILIRIDRRTTVLKTRLTAAQIRANRTVQLDPP